jgi:transposase InsO family protein
MVGPAAERDAFAHLKSVMGLSERRACQIISADRKTIRYRSCRPPEVELRSRLRDLANERRRFGYRRLFILLRREGEPSGVNCIYRLYREEGLSVRKRKTRRRAVGTRAPILVVARPMRDGHWISFTTSSPVAAASACSKSWTTLHANASPGSRTRPSPVDVSPES